MASQMNCAKVKNLTVDIKANDYNDNLLEEKRKEAISQLDTYSKDERLDISILKKYVVIFVGHNLKVLEEV